MASAKANVAVLISGNGSNLQSLIDAARQPDYPAHIALVVSNQPDAYGVIRARNEGVPVRCIPHRDYSTREDFDRAVHATLTEHGIEIVCLAGFMRLLSPWFVGQWKNRLLNIHPSLLPAFKGAHAVRDALAAGVAETGCTVHWVTEELDAGPIVTQATVPVMPEDTEASLHARIHAAEHRLYPEALRTVCVQLAE